jgi:signal-transduction protein with cAMP-binding, CBS, and nucleotidyltransferase domain
MLEIGIMTLPCRRNDRLHTSYHTDAEDGDERTSVPDPRDGAGPRTPVHSLVKALRGVPDFSPLDDVTLLRIVGGSSNLAFARGALVFEAGSHSDALYVVLSGRVRIFDTGETGEVDVALLGPGQSFGEISLLLHTEHTKSAQAVEPSELMVLPLESLDEVLESNPELKVLFERRIEQRRAVRGQVSGSS